MLNPETLKSPENFTEVVSDTLLQIYEKLNNVRLFTPETLNHNFVDEICNNLKALEQQAESNGDQENINLISTLEVRFYALHTTGVVDKPQVFDEKVADAYDLLEIVLKTMLAVKEVPSQTTKEKISSAMNLDQK